MNATTAVKPAIIVFPGSNCDQDMAVALQQTFKLEPIMLWHMDDSIPEQVTHVILPGGFSFGDYVRAGAMAAHSPIMGAIKNFALHHGRILGVCNGFQILCESGLLPGVLLKNHHDRFVCRVESVSWFGMKPLPTPITLRLPIAHREGRFYAERTEMDRLLSSSIAMTYDGRDKHGDALSNGSLLSIAGLRGGPSHNILGLMPHPERAVEQHILGCDGQIILQDFLYG
jgi:phosphoribosylformylglycinamidine synthase subunit PurQ / glutaminase